MQWNHIDKNDFKCGAQLSEVLTFLDDCTNAKITMITVIIHYYTIQAVEVQGLLYVFFVLIPLIISHKFHAFYIGIFAHANKSKSKNCHNWSNM
jgi:hypothetical protein